MKRKLLLLPVLSGLFLSATALSQTAYADDTVTILHTNDIHGRIEEGRGVIGMAKLATAVEDARAEGTTLVLDAGDAFQGLPISNSTKGEDMAQLMNEIGYDAMAVGNHEFDFSLEQAEKYKETLNFPLLSANTYVNDARLFEASTVIDKTPDVTGDEFVVIGVTTLETATKTHPNNIVGVEFRDPITEVTNVITEIENKASYNNYIILAHLGIDNTTPVEWRGSTLAEALAANEILKNKRVIVIDGHSHTVSQAQYGTNVTYTQTGSYLNNIGKLTLSAAGVEAGLISTAEGQALTPHQAIKDKVAAIKAKYDAENAVVVLENSPVELNGDRENVRVRETNLGNVVTDALYVYGQTGFSKPTDLAVTNGGGLRATIAKDKPVTKGDIIAVLPFGNSISQIEVTGQQIYDMFKKSLGSGTQTSLDANGNPLLEASGGFLHTAGAYVVYDTNLPADERILGIQIFDRETAAYKDLDLNKIYYLATNDFLAAGGDDYTMLGGAREEGPSLDSVLADYLTSSDFNALAYEAINPTSRLVSVDSRKHSDQDLVPDYLEDLWGEDKFKSANLPIAELLSTGELVIRPSDLSGDQTEVLHIAFQSLRKGVLYEFSVQKAGERWVTTRTDVVLDEITGQITLPAQLLAEAGYVHIAANTQAGNQGNSITVVMIPERGDVMVQQEPQLPQAPVTNQPVASSPSGKKQGQVVLPATGDTTSLLAGLGLVSLLSGLGLVTTKKRF